MIKFKTHDQVPKDFTGLCQITFDNSIRYYKNGLIHHENEPAIRYNDSTKIWCLNGLQHREDGPAIEYEGSVKRWFYKGECFGTENDFTIESWKEKVKELKRKEELKIFK